MIDRAVTRITKQPRRRWPRSDQNRPSSVSGSSRRSAPIKDRSSPTRSPKSCLGSRSRSSNDPIKRKARGTEHHAPVSEVAGCCGTRAGASAGNIEFSLTMPTSGTSTTCTHEHIGNRSDASPEKGLAFASKESMHSLVEISASERSISASWRPSFTRTFHPVLLRAANSFRIRRADATVRPANLMSLTGGTRSGSCRRRSTALWQSPRSSSRRPAAPVHWRDARDDARPTRRTLARSGLAAIRYKGNRAVLSDR